MGHPYAAVAWRGEKPQCQNAPTAATHTLTEFRSSNGDAHTVLEAMATVIFQARINYKINNFIITQATANSRFFPPFPFNCVGKWRKNMIMAMEIDGKMVPLMGGKGLLPFITANVIALSGLIENINIF